MDLSIAAILAQDGITSGAIYTLLAMALVLVFSVTRVILIPQGEFVSYGALTFAMLQSHQAPPTAALLAAVGAVTFLRELPALVKSAPRGRLLPRAAVNAGKFLLLPAAVWWLCRACAPLNLPLAAQIALAFLVVAPMGPMLYRLVYQPMAEASVLLLLIASVGLHFAMTGLGLVMFGAEGLRAQPFSDAQFHFGALQVSAQSLTIVLASLVMIVALFLYFGRSLAGKALRATAVNRLGAQLTGIGTSQAGRLAFGWAATLGALAGVLVAPLTTIYYDSGFMISLKGFIGAIMGGLGAYPAAAAGAVLVGLFDSFASFWASAYKEVIVFTLIIPVLMWLSLTSRHADEEE